MRFPHYIYIVSLYAYDQLLTMRTRIDAITGTFILFYVCNHVCTYAYTHTYMLRV